MTGLDDPSDVGVARRPRPAAVRAAAPRRSPRVGHRRLAGRPDPARHARRGGVLPGVGALPAHDVRRRVRPHPRRVVQGLGLHGRGRMVRPGGPRLRRARLLRRRRGTGLGADGRRSWTGSTRTGCTTTPSSGSCSRDSRRLLVRRLRSPGAAGSRGPPGATSTWRRWARRRPPESRWRRRRQRQTAPEGVLDATGLRVRRGEGRLHEQTGGHRGEQRESEGDRRGVERGGRGRVAVLADEPCGERERGDHGEQGRDRG